MGTKDIASAVAQAVAAIEKQFGRGSIMRLGEQPVVKDHEAISTGCIGIDRALGIGGLPRGRVVEIFGPESSGKTTLALHAIASVHDKGGTCAFIDAEHALDVSYAQKLGVDPDRLLVSQPDSGEQALEICEMLVRSGAVNLLVVDSVAALVPRAEIEGEMGDAHMGLQARLMSQAMRKLTGIAHRSGCTLVFINQLRQKIGVVFGNPEVTTGGNALKFYASVRIEVRRIGAIKGDGGVVGNRTRVKVVKNKLAPPFMQAEVDVVYGKGIWAAADLVDQAIEAGIITRSGSWLSMRGQQLGQGREKVAKYFEENTELSQALRQELLDPSKNAASQTLGDSPKSSKGDKSAKASEAKSQGEQSAPAAA